MKSLQVAIAILLTGIVPALAQEAAGAAAMQPLTLRDVLLKGGPLMIPLIALSFIATLLIFVYFLSIRRTGIVTGKFMATADALLRKRDFLGLLALSNRHTESVARVMRKTLDFITKNPNAEFAHIREVAETEGARQASELNNRISYLSDVGVIAPMVGLLGTVFGMIQSFSVLASDVAASRPQLLANGVAQALITTAAGLVIGIPALIFYSYFRGRVQKLVSELEAACTELLALISVYHTRKRVREPIGVEEEEDF